MDTISDRIKYLLKISNLKQSDLAKKINIDSASITKYIKNGTIPSAEIIGRIAIALNTTTDYLILGIEKSPEDMELELLVNLYNKLNDLNKRKIALEMRHLYAIQNLEKD